MQELEIEVRGELEGYHLMLEVKTHGVVLRESAFTLHVASVVNYYRKPTPT